MQLPSPDRTPPKPPPEEKASHPTPTLGTGLTLPSSAESERDAQRFQDIMSSILHRGARPDDVREALTATLRNEVDRKIILSMLSENGLPNSLEAKHRRPFIDAVLPCAESEGDLGWDALDSIVKSAFSLKDYQLYEHLGHEFCKRAVPALSVFNSAMIFQNLRCHNVAQYPEAAAWVEFFKTQGTPHAFQTIHTELFRRIRHRELSSYDHLVGALCTTNNQHALDILQTSLNKILVDSRPPLTPHRAGPKDLLVASCRALPLSALLVMISIGPQHVVSLTTLTVSGIFGITELLLKRKQPQQQPPKSRIPDSQVGAYDTFMERAHEKLCAVEDLSPQARRIKELLDYHINNLRTVKE